MKYNSLFLLDDIAATDTIPLTNMVEFVRTPPADTNSVTNIVKFVQIPPEIRYYGTLY